MRKVFLMLALLVAAPVFSAPVAFKGTPDEAKALQVKKEQAQALKAKGDAFYEEAAGLHPQSLCRAMYLWNAACFTIGKRNAQRDWVYDPSKRSANPKASDLLDRAEAELNAPDEYGCKGVDADTLRKLIAAVRRQIQLHP